MLEEDKASLTLALAKVHRLTCAPAVLMLQVYAPLTATGWFHRWRRTRLHSSVLWPDCRISRPPWKILSPKWLLSTKVWPKTRWSSVASCCRSVPAPTQQRWRATETWNILGSLPDGRREEGAGQAETRRWGGAGGGQRGRGAFTSGDDEFARWKTSPGELPRPITRCLPEAGSRAGPPAAGESRGPGEVLSGQRPPAAHSPSVPPPGTTPPLLLIVFIRFMQLNLITLKPIGTCGPSAAPFFLLHGIQSTFRVLLCVLWSTWDVSVGIFMNNSKLEKINWQT